MLRRRFLASVLALLPAAVLAQEPTRSEVVRFARGRSSATIRGSITGEEAVDYIVGARRGQRMVLRLVSNRPSTYYQVILPDGGDPLHDSREDGDYVGTLPVNGDYAVRVYNNRNEARRNRRADFTLTIQITGDGGSRRPSGGK